MSKISLDIFRFTQGVDYLPYFQKIKIPFNPSLKLSDVLKLASKQLLNFDSTFMPLRINGIAIFENLSLDLLVKEFGFDWQISPLSEFYAKKDLSLDLDSMLCLYDWFFKKAKFLSEEEKLALNQYLLLNCISPLSLENYFGDGFFFYIKWLLSRHLDKQDFFMKILSDEKSGILNFVNLADFVYPKAVELDLEMLDFIRNCFFSANTPHLKAHKKLYKLALNKYSGATL